MVAAIDKLAKLQFINDKIADADSRTKFENFVLRLKAMNPKGNLDFDLLCQQVRDNFANFSNLLTENLEQAEQDLASAGDPSLQQALTVIPSILNEIVKHEQLKNRFCQDKRLAALLDKKTAWEHADYIAVLKAIGQFMRSASNEELATFVRNFFAIPGIQEQLKKTSSDFQQHVARYGEYRGAYEAYGLMIMALFSLTECCILLAQEALGTGCKAECLFSEGSTNNPNQGISANFDNNPGANPLLHKLPGISG